MGSSKVIAAIAVAAVVFAGGIGSGPAAATSPVGDPSVAAVQVALRHLGLYSQTIDGFVGPKTRLALLRFQTRARLVVTGQVDAATRAALDARVVRPAGLTVGTRGLAVAALQFRLAWHGFPSGPFTTKFTPRVERALLRFQHWAHLVPDGVAGARTISALRAPLVQPNFRLTWPLIAPVGDPFGPRGPRFHTGIDLVAPAGADVRAAAVGTVVHAGWLAGGWGNTVIVRHGPGLRTLYAHLSVVSVRVGTAVSPLTSLGLVGATGDATGPHLHFEEQVRGAAVDPQPSLPAPL